MEAKPFMKIYLPSLLLFLFISVSSAYAEISGKAETIPENGFIKLKGKELSLKGINIISHNALCKDTNGQWSCGESAWEALKNKLESGTVHCTIVSDRQNKKKLPEKASCLLEKENLSIWLIIGGWALTNKDAENLLTEQEHIARINNEGIWRGGFIPPDLWRINVKKKSKNCNVCSIRRHSFLRKNSKQQSH